MGNVLRNSGTSKPLGKSFNLNKVTEGFKVNVVKPEGPFNEPAAGEAETALVSDFWKDQKVVIHMHRRFGCPLCRTVALDLKSLSPVLKKHNVRMVGIGLGYNSLEDFMKSKAWEGEELYVDVDKDFYKSLGLGQGGLRMLLDSSVIAESRKASELGLGGNLQGDGMQLGGTYVVDKGGDILMEFQQKNFADHASREDILTALGIDLSEMPTAPSEPMPTCDST